MKTIVTTCRVEKNPSTGRKRWIVIRNDFDPESVGETTICGMPFRPEEVPVGTLIVTTVTIPES